MEVVVFGQVSTEQEKILSPGARSFLGLLHKCFESRRQELLQNRARLQAKLDSGILPDFLPETEHIRRDRTWKGPSPAPGLVDRRVEITGPVDRKMVINALNTSATQYMADFEDSTSPTWKNLLEGQVNLYDAVRGTITFTNPDGRSYRLKESGRPTLLVRPRGWHLDERHVLVDGVPMSASLFDFGLFFFHNAKELVAAGVGPYFYLPKMEHHLEARLWNDVFIMSQDFLRLPRGTVRATVLIETLLAAFQMDEILFELRDHTAGLNCGRWDYIFSYIKKLRSSGNYVLPDRSAVTMTVPFMNAYVQLLIRTCHQRGVHAMGGMAAQIPIKSDPVANSQAIEKVKQDKLREVLAGHDGTWVAHPDLIPVALEIFNKHMPQSNQIFVPSREIKEITSADLLRPPPATPISIAGITSNVQAALLYISSWLRGQGCLPINYLMEDAATAEIARSQLWQWVHHSVSTTDTKEKITPQLIEKIAHEQVKKLSGNKGNQSMEKASQYLLEMVKNKEFAEFITTYCYSDLVTVQKAKL